VKFKVDENLPRDVCDLLQGSGHDAVSVGEQGLGGADDPQLFRVCQDEGRVLVTLDVDFANVHAYPPASTPGLIVLRLARQDRPHVLAVLRDLLPQLEREPPDHRLWIVEDGRIRIRE